jgi:hypothetical protein
VLPSTARPPGILLRRSDVSERRTDASDRYIHVGFCATSLSRKSRKRFPDTHAFKVFSFLISGLRYLNTVIISEESEESPRDFQGRLPKKG